MREIKLNNNLIDDEDYELIKNYSWQVWISNKSNTLYAKTTIYKPRKKTISLHCLIMNVINPKIKVDHINGNGLDNRKSNLRLCTHQENCCNRTKSKKCLSKFKGVSYYRQLNKWSAYIRNNYKLQYLGIYKNEIDAAKAYNEKAIELFGEFAKLNDISCV